LQLLSPTAAVQFLTAAVRNCTNFLFSFTYCVHSIVSSKILS